MEINPLLEIDGYKTGHKSQYPSGTTLVYSNLTARNSRLSGINRVVFFGMQYAMMRLQERFIAGFFKRDREEVVGEYERVMKNYLGAQAPSVDHIRELWDLQYLPLEVRAQREGTAVPVGIPLFTIHNTQPAFFWLTNHLETVLSSMLWQPITTATLACEFRRRLDAVAAKAGIPVEFTRIQGHDFSFRGMSSPETAAISGAAHLLSFSGTDTIPGILLAQRYYGASPDVGCSIPATEHSVMCMGGEADEYKTFKRLITEVYPSGPVSIVSDTWDFWEVLTVIAPRLKHEIMKRDGITVLRPDSGDPVKIVCGDPEAKAGSPEYCGAMEILIDTFGYKKNSQGYKQLDSHVGLIYGDSITLERQAAICDGLMKKGICPSVVFGIGSFSYQYNTRDTFGMAMKATYGEVKTVDIMEESETIRPRDIFKSPKTGSSSTPKASARGLLAVEYVDGVQTLFQQQTWDQSRRGELVPVFSNGEFCSTETFSNIRKRLHPRW